MSPVSNTAGPFPSCVHGGEIEHFEQGFIRWKDAITLGNLEELAVVALNGRFCHFLMIKGISLFVTLEIIVGDTLIPYRSDGWS